MPFVEHAVIAAAGMGRRLGYGLPKCLLDIDGTPLITAQLELLKTVPDVRVVVGYRESDVIDVVRRSRSDAIFVRNPRYAETTTQDSYALGCKHVAEGCLFMDADIWFDPRTFSDFLRVAPQHRLAIGVTESKTEDAVFVTIDNGLVQEFSRDQRTPYEWANIVWAAAGSFQEGSGEAVFERLRSCLPATALQIRSFEVDTEVDLARARAGIQLLRSASPAL